MAAGASHLNLPLDFCVRQGNPALCSSKAIQKPNHSVFIRFLEKLCIEVLFWKCLLRRHKWDKKWALEREQARYKISPEEDARAEYDCRTKPAFRKKFDTTQTKVRPTTIKAFGQPTTAEPTWQIGK